MEAREGNIMSEWIECHRCKLKMWSRDRKYMIGGFRVCQECFNLAMEDLEKFEELKDHVVKIYNIIGVDPRHTYQAIYDRLYDIMALAEIGRNKGKPATKKPVKKSFCVCCDGTGIKEIVIGGRKQTTFCIVCSGTGVRE